MLANIVMAWNTQHLQLAVDQTPGAYRRVLKGIAAIGYKHINLRGILTFDLASPDGACSDDRRRRSKDLPHVKKQGFFCSQPVML